MNIFDKERFKTELLAKGVDWSDQQIDNYLALKKSSNNLKVEMTKYNAPALYDTVRKWETGDRASRHNNPGAHIYTKELANKFGAIKGEPFQDSDGRTYNTAKYSTPEAGERATKFVINKIASESRSPQEFTQRYTGLDTNSQALANYTREVSSAFGPPRPTRAQGYDPLTGGRLDRYGDYSQGDKNAILDFAGNFLWEALDTTTFGALGALDRDDALETAITGGGPETFAGRVGAGLGGFAGFLVPFGATKAIASKAVKAGKYGASRAAKTVVKEGTDFLGTQASKANKYTGYSKFRKLDQQGRENLFKPIIGQSFGTIIKKGEDVAAFAKRYDKSIETSIRSQLKKIGIRPEKDTVNKLRQIVDEATSLSKGNHIPITTLQQRIAIMLGGTAGAGKLASVASHALEEAILFAAVETPMEIFQSIDENREMDLGGRAAHAFALGSALGLIRFIPGGKNWGEERGITRAAWKNMKRQMNKKRPYTDLDPTNPEARDQMRIFAESMWKALGDQAPTVFTAKLGNKIVPSIKKLKDFASTDEGGRNLQKILQGFEAEWQKRWQGEFWRSVGQDLYGSTPRMIAGSMAFNYEMVFSDEIPLEDKVFHTLLGAFMTKGGRKLSYTDGNGYIQTIESTGAQHNISDKLIDASNNLRMLGLHPKNAILSGIESDYVMNQQWHTKMEETSDVKLINKILKESGVIEDNNEAKRRAPKNAGVPGEHPIYERAKWMFDRFGNENYRMVDVDRLPIATIKKVEKKLANNIFESLSETAGSKGITKISDFDDIIYSGSDKAFTEFVQLHKDAGVAIYNYLGKNYNREAGIETTRDGTKIPRLHPILHAHEKNLSEDFSKVLIKYNRLAEALNKDGYVNFDDRPDRYVTVKEKDFEGILELVNDYESKLSEHFYGETPGTRMVDTPELMHEGWMEQLLHNQSYHKQIRNTHDKLKDLNDKEGLWHDAEDAKKILDFIEHSGLIRQKNGYLYKSYEFGPNVQEHHQRFLNSFLQALRGKADANVPMQSALEATKKVNNVGDINEVRRILKRNQITGFDNPNSIERMQFLRSLSDYSMDRFLKGARKADGSVLNDTDMPILRTMLDLKIMSNNFHTVDIPAVINEISKTVDMSKITLDKKGQITGFKLSEKEFLERADHDLVKLLSEVGTEQNQSVMDIAKDLLAQYKTILEPYKINPNAPIGKKHGFLSHKGDFAQVTPTQLAEWISKLNLVIKTKEHASFDQLLGDLQTIKDNKQMPDLARQQLNYLFAQYGSGARSTTELISILANNKLFSYKDNKIKIESDNKTLTEQLNTVLKETDLSLTGNGESAIIEGNINAYRTGFSKRSEVEIYDNISKQSFLQKYTLAEDYDFTTKNREAIIKDLQIKQGDELIKYEAMKPEQQFEALMDVVKMLGNTEQTRNVSRLHAVEGYGIFSDMNYKVYDNSFFRFLDKIGATYRIVDLDLQTKRNNLSDARTDKVSEDIIMNLLNHNGSKKYIDSELRTDDFGALNYEQVSNGSLLVRLGDTKYGFAIEKTDIPNIAKRFDEKLKGWKSKYKSSEYKPVFKYLEKTLNDLVEIKDVVDSKSLVESGEKNVEKTYTLKPKSVGDLGKYLTGQSKELQSLMTADFMNNNMGKYFWDHWANTFGGNSSVDVTKLFRRIKLMANLSMKEVSMDHVNNTLSIFKNHLTGKEHQSSRKALETFKKNNGFDIMIARDEAGQASIIKRLEEYIEADKLADPANVNNFLDKGIGIDGEGKPTWFGGKDVSHYDSAMYVDKQTMEALYALMGSGHIEGLGGIKPIIHRLGDSVILGKTAFVREPKVDAFLAKNKVNAILFESGAKVNHDLSGVNVFKDWTNHKDFYTNEKGEVLKIDNMDKYREHLNPEDISLGAVVNSDHKATLPFQAFNHLDIAESQSVYDTYVKDNMNRFRETSQDLFASPDFTKSIALAKYLNSAKDVSDAKSSYSRMLQVDGIPTGPLFANQFVAQIKSKFIDEGGIIKLNTPRGGQSVLSPNPDLRYTRFVKNAEGGNDIHSYGQMSVPNVAGKKKILVDNLHFIKHNKDRKDQVILGKTILTDLNNNMTLEQVFKKLGDYNTKNNTTYEIAAVVRRNPNTRPGDMPILGIKEILSTDYGNQAKVNAYDVAMRLEGDFDIDKIDFWWDSPTNILNKWDKLSGEIIRVTPEPLETKYSLSNKGDGISWDDPISLNNHSAHVAKSEKLRGTVVKMQRLLAALKNYTSNSNIVDITTNKNGTPIAGNVIKGLSIRRGNAEGKGFLYLNEANLKESYKLLAEDIQRVTDSLTGYNDRIYDMNYWMDKFLFGDGLGENSRYKGLFSKASASKDIVGKWTPDTTPHTVTDIEKDIILQAINPYRRMLQLGTSLFSNGKAQKIRYEDIISEMRHFDGRMKYLPQNTYKHLKRLGHPEEKIRQYLLKKPELGPKSGNFWDTYGEFGEQVRPNFINPSEVKFDNMLVFEKVMSKLAFNNHMRMDKPYNLQGSSLQEYQSFYDKNMYVEGFNEAASNAIKTLKSENKIFGYINFLDYRIRNQQNGRRNAMGKGWTGLAEHIDANIKDMQGEKAEIESKLVLTETDKDQPLNKSFYRNLRDASKQSLRNQIIDNQRVPNNWRALTKERVYPFTSKAKAIEYVFSKEGREALDKYVKGDGIVRFKGINSAEHLEMLAWNNIVGKYKEISVDDSALGHKETNREMNNTINTIESFHRDKWKKFFDGSDWVMNQNRVNNLIYDKIRTEYLNWELGAKGKNMGRLFLWKLMTPKTDPFTYTYFNGRISPAFKTRSLSMIKAVLNFISRADNKIFLENEKNLIYNVLFKARNNVFRAHYGQRGERGIWEYDILSNNENYKNDIMSGFPLLDDIKGWEGGIQEMDLNPQVASLFGYSNRSVSYNLAHQPLMPDMVKQLSNASYMAYMPLSYIPNNATSNRLPEIAGWTSWNKAMQGDAKVMLGHELNLNLLQSKAPNVAKSPFKDVQPKGEGREDINNRINEKGC